MSAIRSKHTDLSALKFAWLQSVAADSSMCGLPTSIAIMIATVYLNSKTRTAWPSIDRLASDVGATRRNVQHAVSKLVKGGHLQRQIGGGKGRASIYQLPSNSVASDAFCRPQTASQNALKGVVERIHTASPATPEPLEEPFDEVSTAAPPPTDCKKAPQKKKAERNGRPRTFSALANPQVRKSGLSEPAGTPLGKPKPATMEAEEWFALAPEDGEPSPRILAYDEFKKAPLKALDIDIQIGRFKEYNAGKRLLPDQWRDLWQRWCVHAVVHARQYAA